MVLNVDCGVEKWTARDCPAPMVERVATACDKRQCFRFACGVILTSRYGLQSVTQLGNYLFELQNADFLRMCAPTGEIVAVLRICLDHDILQYADHGTLHPAIIKKAADGQRFADIGAYLHPAIRNPGHRRDCLGWLLGHAMFWCRRLGQNFIYAQVDSDRKDTYEEKFGLHVVGRSFQVNGWDYDWWPVVLPLDFKGESLSKYPQAREEESEIDLNFSKKVVEGYSVARESVGSGV